MHTFRQTLSRVFFMHFRGSLELMGAARRALLGVMTHTWAEIVNSISNERRQRGKMRWGKSFVTTERCALIPQTNSLRLKLRVCLYVLGVRRRIQCSAVGIEYEMGKQRGKHFRFYYLFSFSCQYTIIHMRPCCSPINVLHRVSLRFLCASHCSE